MVLGLRGFPNVQGGIETHAENLYPLLVDQGFDIEVIVRSAYVPPVVPKHRGAVKFTRLWSPRRRGLEAIVHTFLGVLYAGWRRPDVLHIHSIGPALFSPFARLLGLRVVMTHHGQDYQREKWGAFARTVLKLGESAGVRFANGRIAVSQAIADAVEKRYRSHCVVIRNGITTPDIARTTTTLTSLNLQSGAYVLLVARFVPEKRHRDLIEAFRRAALPGWKLVLVGGADHPDDFTRELEQLVKDTPNTLAAGVKTGEALRELYANAGLFVLPSSHEGLPIVLLEAMSFGLPCLASDIPPNREVGLPDDSYFPVGDVAALAAKLTELSTKAPTTAEREALRQSLQTRFDWRSKATQTATVLRAAMRVE
jgi:glycosyltransferase involved in cell wall biosynthesis